MATPKRPTRRHKRIRLDHTRYADEGSIWHVTIATLGRQPLLADPAFADEVTESLSHQCRNSNAQLLLYVVMPEHVHFVVAVGDKDLIALVRNFKSFTTTLWRKRTGDAKLWQTSFHDHGVRRTENLDELTAYILDNPIRRGLVDDWREYPWIGGSLLSEDESPG